MSGVKGKSGPQKARLNPRHQKMVIEKIRASQIINRLSKHVTGKIEMSSTQVRAAEILLKKCIPDRKSVEHSGEIVSPYQQMSQEELMIKLTVAGLDPDVVIAGISSSAIN